VILPDRSLSRNDYSLILPISGPVTHAP